jgi:hypothetical protein
VTKGHLQKQPVVPEVGSWKFEFANFTPSYTLQTSNLPPLSNLFLEAIAK